MHPQNRNKNSVKLNSKKFRYKVLIVSKRLTDVELKQAVGGRQGCNVNSQVTD